MRIDATWDELFAGRERRGGHSQTSSAKTPRLVQWWMTPARSSWSSKLLGYRWNEHGFDDGHGRSAVDTVRARVFWVQAAYCLAYSVLARRPTKVAAIALANKMARMALGNE